LFEHGSGALAEFIGSVVLFELGEDGAVLEFEFD
jgi:hypothetical protein